MKSSLLIILCFALSACTPFDDAYKIQFTEPSPTGDLEARLVYREISDPYQEHWVVQLAKPREPLSGWDHVIIEFPRDYKVERLNWKNEKKLEIEYIEGSSELSLVDFRRSFRGIDITLKQK